MEVRQSHEKVEGTLPTSQEQAEDSPAAPMGSNEARSLAKRLNTMEVVGVDEDQETKNLKELAVSLDAYRAFRRDKEAEYLAAKQAAEAEKQKAKEQEPVKELKIEEVFPAYREFEVENRLRQVIHELLEPMASVTHDAKTRLKAMNDKNQ